MSSHKHEIDSTLVNIPQLETLRKLADDQERELLDNRKKDQEREKKVQVVHADIYGKIEKLQLQLDDKNRRELGMNERLHKAEERFHQLESAIEDVVRIRALEERMRGVENQLGMKAPSKLMDLEAGLSQLQRLIRENEIKYKENERKMNENERKVQDAISGINMQFHTLTSAQANITDTNKNVQAQLVRLEKQKMDRTEMNQSLSEITIRQKEYKTQLNSYTDTFAEITRSIGFLGDEFKGELEVQRRHVETELSLFSRSISDTQQSCDVLASKVTSLEEMSETVTMMQRQLEDWNEEHNRLNEKVDVILQKKMRDLVVTVRTLGENKVDKTDIIDIVKHQTQGMAAASELKKLVDSLQQIQTHVGELRESCLVDREQSEANHSTLLTGIAMYDSSISALREQIDELSKREYTIVNTVAPTAGVSVPVDHSEEYMIMFAEIQSKLDALENIHHEFKWMKEELERLSVAVANTTGREVERYVPPVVVQAPQQEPGYGYGQVLHDIRDRLDIIEHQYVASSWVSELVQRETDSVRSALDVRMDDLTRSIGVGFDELRDEIDGYDYQVSDIQRWITNFLKKNREAANVVANPEGAFSDLPAIHTKCLVCKREPYSGGIDYTSEALAFNPVSIKPRSANLLGKTADVRRVANDLIIAADAREAQEKILEKRRAEIELLNSSGHPSYALRRNGGVGGGSGGTSTAVGAHSGRSSPPIDSRERDHRDRDSYFNHHNNNHNHNPHHITAISSTPIILPSVPPSELRLNHSSYSPVARVEQTIAATNISTTTSTTPSSTNHHHQTIHLNSATTPAPSSARDRERDRERDTLRHSYTTPVLPDNPEKERKRPSSAGPAPSKITSGKKKGLYKG